MAKVSKKVRRRLSEIESILSPKYDLDLNIKPFDVGMFGPKKKRYQILLRAKRKGAKNPLLDITTHITFGPEGGVRRWTVDEYFGRGRSGQTYKKLKRWLGIKAI